MKKLFLPAAVIAAITLASCSKQDDGTGAYSPGESTPLSFSTFVGKSGGTNTKATDITVDNVKAKGFIVYAYSTNDAKWEDTPANGQANLMRQQYVTWDADANANNGAWTYTPTKYWPVNNGKVSFFAYTSNMISGSLFAKGVSTFDLDNHSGNFTYGMAFAFDADNTIAYQNDLVAAQAVDLTYSTYGGTVPLVFNHLLSRIGFKAKLAASLPDGQTATVTNVEIATTNATDASIVKGGSFYQKLTLADDNWQLYTAMAGHNIPLTDVLTGTVLLTTDPKDINDNTMYLMLIPQTLKKGSLAATISYQISTGGAPVDYKTTITLPSKDTKISINTAYTFNFIFDLKSIIFDGVTTGGWDDADPQPDDTTL